MDKGIALPEKKNPTRVEVIFGIRKGDRIIYL
jgi:hypothetical protein